MKIKDVKKPTHASLFFFSFFSEGQCRSIVFVWIGDKTEIIQKSLGNSWMHLLYRLDMFG